MSVEELKVTLKSSDLIFFFSIEFFDSWNECISPAQVLHPFKVPRPL
ncbi:Uncharacterised protein [Streptococcus pneumoniae]|nr:Uncharacterised protein [Streptococcus pneumoniae]CIW03835.1 Uncharacterised protein [Streptococcus pneumoniae]CIW20356.1 Uncharacterised protein [Streptococcus pneumoniae]